MAKMISYSTDESQLYLRVLVGGRSKVGKTLCAASFPSPVILDADHGLVTLAKRKIKVPTFPFTRMTLDSTSGELNSWLQVHELIVNLKAKKGRFWDALKGINYVPKTLIIDSGSSLSEIFEAEVIAKPVIKDKKAGEQWLDLKDYGVIYTRMYNLIGEMKDLPCHLVFIVGIESFTSENGRVIDIPSMTGNKLGQRIPHVFNDFILLKAEAEPGKKLRYWATVTPMKEMPNLGTRGLDITGDIENPTFEKFVKKEKAK